MCRQVALCSLDVWDPNRVFEDLDTNPISFPTKGAFKKYIRERGLSVGGET